MQTTDAGPDKTTSRFDEALRLAQASLALAPDPAAVRIFTFDSDLTPASLDTLPALTPGDATTDIENSGRALLSQFSSANSITGAIILTDGRVPGADPLTKSPFALQARASEAKLFPLSIGGDVPVNPHGGQLSEAYIHGVNGIVEAVRQVRGTSLNQPGKTVNHALVTSGVGVPTGGAILGRMD